MTLQDAERMQYLQEENVKLAGHTNHHQKIQYLAKLKEDLNKEKEVRTPDLTTRIFTSKCNVVLQHTT